MSKKILIIGSGAIGGTIATLLTYKGLNPHIIVKDPALKSKAKTDGFELTGHHGNIKTKLTAFLPSDLLREKYDVVMIATKANDFSPVAKQILPHLNEDSMVVSLQNGICEDDLGEIVGRERTVGCITGWGATLLDTGKFEMTSGGEFVIGNIDENYHYNLEDLRQILNHIVPTRITKNIYGELYSKLIINSCITTLGGICGSLLGDMLANKKARNIFINVVKEAIDVSDAMNIKVEPYAKKLDYYSLLKGNGVYARTKRQLAIQIIGSRYKRLKSSTLQSLERGKSTEIDWFNGYILRQAKKFGISAEVNAQLVDMIKEIEKGKRKISPDNFNEIELPSFR